MNWVETTKKLPLNGQTVLVFTELRNNKAKSVRLAYHWGNGEFKALERNIDCVDCENTTHWQALPMPPNY